MDSTNQNEKQYDEAILRKFETNVLDVYHKSLPFWNLPIETRLYAIMAAYDSTIIPILFADNSTKSVRAIQDIKTLDDGFIQALRWIFADSKNLEPTSVSNQEIFETAVSFLIYCSQYARIAYFHMMYDQKLAKISADEANRIIRFYIPKDIKGKEPWKAFAARSESLNRLMKNFENKRITLHQNANPIIAKFKYRLQKGRIELEDIKPLAISQIAKLADFYTNREIMLIEDDVDLVGFTFRQYKIFWNAIMRWSLCVQQIFVDLIIKKVPIHECMPTQIIDRKNFHISIQELTQLSPEIINAIVQRSNMIKQPQADIFLQPLIVGNENISWCPFVIQNSQYKRNMLKLMTRTKSLKNKGDDINGSREKPLLKEFGLLIAKKGKSDFKLNRSLKYEDESGEVDLLVHNRRFPDEILLVEGKALLAPDEVNELSTATKVLIRAQDQVLRNRDILNKMPVNQKNSLYPFVNWDKVSRYYLLVVTPESPAGTNYDETVIPAITLEEIKLFLKTRDYHSPCSFWEACKNKIWLRHLEPDEEHYDDISVDNVTYQIPVARMKNNFPKGPF
jgi:hypothetical protein